MLNRNLLRMLILSGLILMMAGAFFIRQKSIVHFVNNSIDEVVFFRMAVQVQEGWENYNTIPYGQELVAAGRELPEYFFHPLYKHPPLFTLLNSLSYRFFAGTRMWPFYPSLLCGLLMIPLVYLIGARVFNRAVGFAAAVMMTLDPIGVMVSQRIWMDSMIGLLVVVSLYLFIIAIIRGRNHYFLISGVISGFGALTKYTGGIGTFIIFVYALFFDRRLFRNRFFIVGLFIPMLILMPWFVWNIQVYGIQYFPLQGHISGNSPHLAMLRRTLLALGIAGIVGGYFCLRYRPWKTLGQEFAMKFRLVVGLTTLLALWGAILDSFNVVHLPEVGWSGAPFYGATRGFYFVRLLEWNLINFFALLSFFILKKDRRPGENVLRSGFLVILIVFTVWGAFQSRYIIAAIPLGILIGTNFLFEFWELIGHRESLPQRIVGRSVVFIIACMIIARMMHINYWISYTTNMCYF